MWRIEYFELLAQIGPVILLSYIVEGGFGAGQDQPTWVPKARIGGLSLTLLGEIQALGVAAGVVDPTGKMGLNNGALMVGGFGILAVMIVGIDRDAAGKPGTGTWLFWLFLVLGWVLVTAQWLV